ncbi:MAG: hypothetical protein AB7Q16_24910 [Vicinamibacterales bacterium]
MTEPSDRELEQWVQAWRAPLDEPAASPEAIHRHVRRRAWLIRLWLAGEALVVAVVAPLIVGVFRAGDAFERMAMAVLGAAGLAAVAFSWWNWHDTLRTSGESIAGFIDLSRLRIARLSRAITAGWVLLAVELMVFVPLIALRSGGAFGWALLAALASCGAAFLLALTRWTGGERERLDAIEGELLDRP